MTTQGMVTVIEYGKVIAKAVAGCDGTNAPALAKLIRENGLRHPVQIREAAREVGFGCEDDLVVYNQGMTCAIDDNLPAEYEEQFANPYFNPRWKYGTAAHIEIVDLTPPHEGLGYNPFQTYPPKGNEE